MRRSRQFRPDGPAPLEGRVVLSHFSLFGHHHASQPKVATVAKPSTIPSPDNIIKGNVGQFQGLDMAQTVKAGNPVFAELTTRYADTSSQTESRLIVPDKANNTVTTTKTLNLRNNQGVEKVVDVATTTGATTNHTITITLPDGAMESETETELAQGNKVLQKGTYTLPGGSTKSFTAVVSTSGNQQTTDETDVSAEGFTAKRHTVITVQNELSQSTTSTTTNSDGTTNTSVSNTSILRLTPPSS